MGGSDKNRDLSCKIEQKSLYKGDFILYNNNEYTSFEKWGAKMEKNKVKLSVCGSEYSILTDDSVEYTAALGDELNEKMMEILNDNAGVSVTQAAVLSALEYCDMYKKAEKSADNLRGQIKDYLEDSARARMEVEVARREVERLSREVQKLQAKLAAEGKR